MHATLSKSFTFDAAHRLDGLPPDHKCHRLHGHTYHVEVIVAGVVQANGFVIDYAEIAAAWAPIHEALDHRLLNEVGGLEVPSTEVLCSWIIRRLRERLSSLARIRVYESSTTWCEMDVGDA